MKSDSNTEMELLLRRHARRGRSTLAPGAGDPSAHEGDETTGSSGTHMDADEMNAYAENALPAPARARYMAHLADCDHCRAIVTNLTLAANVPLKDAEADALSGQTSPRRSWREWLAALLSPPVIRYGVPALVLISVVGIVFLAIRQRDAEQRRSDEPALVARNNDRSATQNTSIVKAPAEGQSPATLASPALREDGPTTPAQPKEAEAGQSAAPLADKESLAKTRTNEQAPAGGPAPTDAPATIAGNEPARQESAAARDQRDEDLAAATPKPAAPPPPVSTAQPSAGARAPEATESDRVGRTRKDDSTSDDRRGAFGSVSNTTSREAEERQKTTTTKSAPASEARARPARRGGALSEGADTIGGAGAGERSSVTRAVGGRQFRRQGNAWIDTAYTQGRATVNVTRGSEQYRALTADEPGLRAIAEQLGGEVVVVWKGRAYRIH